MKYTHLRVSLTAAPCNVPAAVVNISPAREAGGAVAILPDPPFVGQSGKFVESLIDRAPSASTQRITSDAAEKNAHECPTLVSSLLPTSRTYAFGANPRLEIDVTAIAYFPSHV